MAHELNAEENRQFFSAWFEGFAICWTFRKGVNSLWRKKKDDSYVFRRSSECACVRASVKCCFLFIFFNCIYYLCKKEKNSLMVKQMQNFQQRFDLIRSPERRIASFLFGDRIQIERENTHLFLLLCLRLRWVPFPGKIDARGEIFSVRGMD